MMEDKALKACFMLVTYLITETEGQIKHPDWVFELTDQIEAVLYPDSDEGA